MWNDQGRPWLLGVEEELLIIDRAGHPVPAAQLLVDAADSEHVHGELMASMLEVTTPPVSADDVAGAIRSMRARARALARAAGHDIASVATHPIADPASQSINPSERYQRIVQALPQIRELLVCGLHVHVCVPEAEAALRVHQALSCAAPDLIALAANSPFWSGKESGFMSTRAHRLAKLLPRTGPAPQLDSFGAWQAWVDEQVNRGEITDETYLWHDVRLAPRYGTVEVRAFDAQCDWRDSAALARLVEQIARLTAGEDLIAYDPAEATERRRRLIAGENIEPCELLVRASAKLAAADRARIEAMRLRSGARRQLAAGAHASCAALAAWTTC
jgi:carboxylate-amine ligase